MRANEYQTRAMSTRLPSRKEDARRRTGHTRRTYAKSGVSRSLADFHAVLEEMVALRLIEMGRTANDTYVRVIED